MTVSHGSTAKLLLDGYSLTEFAKSAQIVPESDFHDTTVFGATHRSRVPGLKHGNFSAEMFFDGTTTTGSWDVLKTKYNAQSPGAASPGIISFFPQGDVDGSRAVLLYANVNKFDSKAVVDDLTMLSLGAESEQDGVDFGVSLKPFATVTGTDLADAVDNAAQTTNGGVGTLHVTAIVGAAPSVVALIEHSTDDNTWVTLVTFVASTAANTAQRIEVAAGTTVRRYLRSSWTFGGTTTSITFQSSFARR